MSWIIGSAAPPGKGSVRYAISPSWVEVTVSAPFKRRENILYKVRFFTDNLVETPGFFRYSYRSAQNCSIFLKERGFQGGMAEWLIAPVLKTGDRKIRGFKSFSLRQYTGAINTEQAVFAWRGG